jgi:hypothetical protein
MNAAHVSRFDTQGNFPLGREKTRTAGCNFQSSKLQTTRFVFKPDSRHQLFWLNPEVVDLILIGPAWSRDFLVPVASVLAGTLANSRTLASDLGAIRRVGSVRQHFPCSLRKCYTTGHCPELRRIKSNLT